MIRGLLVRCNRMMPITQTKAVGQFALTRFCPLTVLLRAASYTYRLEAVLIYHRSPHSQDATRTTATSRLRIAHTSMDPDRRRVSSVLDSSTSPRFHLPTQTRPEPAFSS